MFHLLGKKIPSEINNTMEEFLEGENTTYLKLQVKLILI